MELLLNTIWALVSLAIGGWCWKHRSASADSAPAWRYLVALVLLAIVLFPVISATDDMCSLMLATEDYGFSKLRATHAVLVFAVVPILAILLLALSLFASRSTVGRAREEHFALPEEAVLAAAAGRAPPVLTF